VVVSIDQPHSIIIILFTFGYVWSILTTTGIYNYILFYTICYCRISL